MSIGSEFKEFIARGNVVDLAVGVIIGGAFGKIVTSLVDGVVMPPIGLITGGIDFSKMKWVLKAADEATKTPETAIAYGAFANTVVQFVIVAIVIFIMVKGINGLRREKAAEPAPPEAPPAPTATELLLTQIRDELKSVRAPAPVAPTPVAAPKPAAAAKPAVAAKAPVAKAPAVKAPAKAPAKKPPAKR